MAIRTITRNLPCIVCGYNLRGLSLDKNCPECAHPAEGTWTAAKGGWHPDAGAVLVSNRINRDWITAGANAAGLSLDGVKFVLDALKGTRVSRARRDPSSQGGVGAAEVCAYVRKHAKRYFTDPAEARQCLSQWHIRTSEDVGAVIFAMVEAGILRAESGDSIGDFKGVFTFDQLIGDILKQAEPA